MYVLLYNEHTLIYYMIAKVESIFTDVFYCLLLMNIFVLCYYVEDSYWQ